MMNKDYYFYFYYPHYFLSGKKKKNQLIKKIKSTTHHSIFMYISCRSKGVCNVKITFIIRENINIKNNFAMLAINQNLNTI